MPNWCSNTAYISHRDAAKISAIVAEVERARDIFEPCLLFDLIRPTPPELHSKGWYEWRLDNWGTKWNPSDVEIYEQEAHRICIHFLTAWAPPTNLYDFMTAQGYEIDAAYTEEGMCFRGTYTSGIGDICTSYDPDEERNEEGELI